MSIFPKKRQRRIKTKANEEDRTQRPSGMHLLQTRTQKLALGHLFRRDVQQFDLSLILLSLVVFVLLLSLLVEVEVFIDFVKSSLAFTFALSLAPFSLGFRRAFAFDRRIANQPSKNRPLRTRRQAGGEVRTSDALLFEVEDLVGNERD